jgi:phosphoribosylglycinamide formyltransferase 1
MKKIVILISGRGSNMEAVVRACARDGWPARVCAVISNRPDAAGLSFAQANGIENIAVDHREFDGREAFDAALAREIDRFEPDLVVLAGFMRVLTDGFVERYAGRMLNIHPSLLPLFPGLEPQAQALRAGVKLSGATVHFVIPETDAGPIVMQGAVAVHEDDTPETLAARILTVEHRIYPYALRLLASGNIRLDSGVCKIDGSVVSTDTLISPTTG